MHQANKYHRIQDTQGRIGVIVPEVDFILHTKQMNDLANKVKGMEEDLRRLNAKHHEYLDYKRNVQETIAKEVQKARTQQRQDDAKVYAHWRDKAKELEDQVKELRSLKIAYEGVCKNQFELLKEKSALTATVGSLKRDNYWMEVRNRKLGEELAIIASERVLKYYDIIDHDAEQSDCK